MRILRGLAALVVTIALVVGAPVALLVAGQLDAFARVDWAHLLTTPDSGALLMGLLTVFGWLAWALFVLGLLAEVVGVVTRGRSRPRIPATGWLQPLTAMLVLAIVAMVPGASRAAADDAGAAPTPVATASAAVPVPSEATRSPSETPAADALAPSAAPVGPDVTGPAAPTHVVREGDDLWTIAVQHYGDGTKWRQVAEANGIHPDEHLAAGRVLLLPGARTSPPPPASAMSPREEAATGATSAPARSAKATSPRPGRAVVVQPGDSLSAIAAAELDDAERWPEIAELNRDLVVDPDLIQPGWHLVLPAAEAGTRTAQAPTGPPAKRAPAAHPKSPTPSEGPTRPATADQATTPTASATPTESATATRPMAAEHPEPLALPDSGAEGSGPPPTTMTSPAAGASTRASSALTDAVVTEDDHAEDGDRLEAIGAMAAIVAASLTAAIAVRRRRQLQTRPLGRRIAPAPEAARELESALRARGSLDTDPDRAWPEAAVVVGVDDDEQPVLHDLEAAGLTVITGPDEERRSALCAALTSLVSAGWSAETTVVLSGDEFDWMGRLESPQLRLVGDTEAGVVEMERSCAARRIALGRRSLGDLRAARETGEAWLPQVHVFSQEPSPAQWERIVRALRLGEEAAPVGVSAITTRAALPNPFDGEVLEVSADTASLRRAGTTFVPQLLARPARRALMDLFEATTTTNTEPAPWWSSGDDDLPPHLAALDALGPVLGEEDHVTNPHQPTTGCPAAAPEHPTLLLLGPVQISGARGEAPSRARHQCAEYCAWILHNPGRTAAAMNRELLVADSTRRSNLSRLRAWLGQDDDGVPYLPEAYTGRIALHPAVSSDWEQMRLLVQLGADRASSQALVDALSLVRGAPLADAAPGSWGWAEAERVDMVSTIRDIGVVLARRALDEGQPELARWAASRALRAAPDDELLLVERIRTEHVLRNRAEVERLVLHLTRTAKILEVDLSPESVEVLQQVMEGRRRAQYA